MGRMNNNRRRAENAEVINKSTRSRFSTWKPPTKQKKSDRRDRDERWEKRNTEERVIGKLAARGFEKAKTAPKSATAAALERQRKMLAGVDADALEGVDMSREHMRLVTELLRSYGVVDADSDSDDDDDDAVAAGLDALALAPTRLDAATPAFTPGAPPPPEPTEAPEPAPPPPPPPAEAPAERAKPAEQAKPAPSFAPGEPPKDREAAAIWAHLTRRLSFSEARAHQALGALRGAASLSGALDWLCVRLDEAELTASLKRNPKKQTHVRVIVEGTAADTGGLELAGAFDWARESAAGALESLGFENSHAKEALKRWNNDEAAALVELAGRLVDKRDLELSATELALAREERNDELEATKAIFGEGAVKLSVTPRWTEVTLLLDSLDLRPPASKAASSLVFYYDDDAESYPVRGPPRLLFRNALLPPGVLRSLHAGLAAHVLADDGSPALFEAAQWLADHASEEQAAFLKALEPEPEPEEEEVVEPGETPEERDARKATEALAEDARNRADAEARVKFLQAVNAGDDVAAAKKRAEAEKRDALIAEGVVEEEAAVERKPKASDFGAAFDARARALGCVLGEPDDVCRSLLSQALAKKDVKKRFDEAGDDAWEDAFEEARRLHGVRGVAAAPDERRGLSVNNMPENFVPSPLLADIMSMIDATTQEQPWLVSPDRADGDGAEAPPDAARPTAAATPAEEERTESERAESSKLKRDLDAKRKDDAAYAALRRTRETLPAYELGGTVVKAIRNHRVVVVSADTGAGKTTQVPQLVLDDCIDRGDGARCSMVVTQPRRISAIGVATRVAQERCERVGDTVGYSIRGESRRSQKTRILLCTTGVLLRRLQCDADLTTLSHVFVDEVHERDLSTDFLLIIMRELLVKRPSIKLVLMSATLNASLFATYFKEFSPFVATIPGRAHPVEAFFLEDALALTRLKIDARHECAVGSFKSKQASRGTKRGEESGVVGLTKREWARRLPDYGDDVHASLSALDPACVNYDLVVKLCEAIFGGDASATAKRVFETVKDDAEGAILVFMPGLAEITETVTKLRASAALEGRATIFALHSQLSTAEQAAIFQRARKGTRKIVVSTNIAETSITIDDVVYVVDCARVKENRYDADRGLATLEEVFVSRAAARQRRGRAGRVRSGVAFHLVTREAHDAEFDAYPQPEILRTSLEDLVLQILVLDLGDPKVFLNKAVSPPTAAAVDRAIELLAGIDALEPFAEDRKVPKVAALTALGFHLASLPVEPRVGKLLLVGAMRVRRRPSFRFRIAR